MAKKADGRWPMNISVGERDRIRIMMIKEFYEFKSMSEVIRAALKAASMSLGLEKDTGVTLEKFNR